MLAREGIVMNHEKLQRLYREENLALVVDPSLSALVLPTRSMPSSRSAASRG
jgi:hypothetical protein